MADPLRLTFVLCPSFHGATLLSLLLNNHSTVSALGDTVPWRRPESVCACGQPVTRCEFWRVVIARLPTDRYQHLTTFLPLAPPMIVRPGGRPLLPWLASSRLNYGAWRAAGVLAGGRVPLASGLAERRTADFAELYLSFYQLVREMHGTTTVVDGSKVGFKVPVFVRHLRGAADIRIVHLVRDPRGFAASSRRHGLYRVEQAGRVWRKFHAGIRSLAPVARMETVRYEDLVADVRQTMARVQAFLDVPVEDLGGRPRRPVRHHLVGNEMLRTFDGTIEPDTRWMTLLTPEEQRRVLRDAGPLAEVLGYGA